MNNSVLGLIIRLFLTLFIAVILTPLVRMLAFKIGATDKPGPRRINKTVMPTMGGLAIYLTFVLATLIVFRPFIPFDYILPIIVSSTVIVLTGVIDDVKELSPKKKLIGILIAALIVYFWADIRLEHFQLPFLGELNLGIFSLPVTLLWITAITNAVNLIDGLDGLASGVSMIALTTMGIIANFFILRTDFHITLTIFILVACIAGFFPYNFHPAKIFLGDTGALFLGFMISVMSLQGLKTVTFISLISPLVILGVPITDTLYAIIRRKVNNKPISSADKMHLHHRLLSMGFTHRGAVLTIYGLALIFSFTALVYNYTSFWGAVLLTIILLLGLELFVELIGLVGPNRQPLLHVISYIGSKNYRECYKENKDMASCQKEQHKPDADTDESSSQSEDSPS